MLKAHYALYTQFGNLRPFSDMIRPFLHRQFAPVQVFRNLPQTSIGFACAPQPRPAICTTPSADIACGTNAGLTVTASSTIAICCP